ncbi:PilW family protein [Persephonella sp.]
MRNKGFSIIELLITIVIVALIMSAAYYTYTTIFRGMKEEGESVELQMEKVIGLELLRLDIEHAGYGIGNTTDKIIEWNNGLIIRSTLNNSNQDTFGWVICREISGSSSLIRDERKNTSVNMVFIDTLTGNYITVANSCPTTGSNGIYIGFPIESGADSCNVGGTNTCNTITYTLSTNQPLSHCNPNTRNLLRKINNGSGIPILSCVSDFAVSFDIDDDDDGIPDRSEVCRGTATCNIPSDNNNIRNQIIRINFYAVMQEGGLNKDYSYRGGNQITIDGINLNLPSNYLHYRWKVIKLTVKPRGMFGGIIGAK